MTTRILNLGSTLASGLRGYWDANIAYTGGTARDWTNFANPLTQNAFASGDTPAYNGLREFKFNGSSYLDGGAAGHLNITGAVTLAAVLRSAGAGGTDRGIIGKGSYGSTGFTIAHGGAGNLMLGHIEGSFAAGTTAITSGEWYYVVMTWDQVNIRIWVNGINEGTTAKTGTSTPTGTNFELGRRPGSGTNWTGSIARASIWNRALTSGEVLELYRLKHDLTTSMRHVTGRRATTKKFRRTVMNRTGSRGAIV